MPNQPTPREKAINALELRPPFPGKVPTFELEFQLTEELLGKPMWVGDVWRKATSKERERLLKENAELYLEVAERLDYCILMLSYGVPDDDGLIAMAQHIHRLVGDRYLLLCHGDATFSIPTGSDMVEFAAAFFERPEEMHQIAKERVRRALERGKRLREACGIDGFALCSDYCFNTGPFWSPSMFHEFITPYLTELTAGYRAMGAYVIKHTDGNIMPILDQLLESNPHGLHALDCQASDMDIAVIKKLTAGKVCLLGGVQCSLLQTGTEEQIVAHCKYVLRHGMVGGGFIYATTNVAFKGLPLERYLLMLEVRDRYGWYDEHGNPCPELFSEGDA